ncbi:MAG: DUF5671 domain-containing protein [Pseudomonadota bacterium]
MSDTKLDDFVAQALKAGATRDETENALRDAGWSSDQISGALENWAQIDFPIPVPKPKAHLSAKDAFVYLILFSALYVTAYNLGALLFQFIEIAFPDATERSYVTEYRESRIRWAVASLIVAFPVFFYAERWVRKTIAAEPTRRNSLVRKWLTYLTMALAVAIVVGDSISLIYRLLGGELQTRFFLKSLVVAAIASGILVFYLTAMRSDDDALNR